MSLGQLDRIVDTWTTQDGRVLKIVDMDDSHLRNTVRFLMAKLSAMALRDTPKESWKREHLKKVERERVQNLKVLSAEAARRGLEIS